MTDEELLRAVHEACKEGDPLADPRLDDLAHGRLSAEDRAALEALARSSDDAALRYEAFRPIDSAGIEAIVGAVVPREPAARPRALPRVLPRVLSRSRAALGAAGVGLALAASAMIALHRPALDSLPSYQASLAGEEAQRSEPASQGDAPRRFGPGSRFDLVIRPAVSVKGQVAARAFLLRGSDVRAWPVQADVSEDGAVRIAGSFDALFAGVSPGRWDVAVLIGRPGALPEDASAARSRILDEGGRETRVVRVPLEIVAR